MWILRESVSVLLGNGHPFARRYPLGLLLDEARLVNNRINRHNATSAMTIRMAIASILDKDAGKEFQKMILELTK